MSIQRTVNSKDQTEPAAAVLALAGAAIRHAMSDVSMWGGKNEYWGKVRPIVDLTQANELLAVALRLLGEKPEAVERLDTSLSIHLPKLGKNPTGQVDLHKLFSTGYTGGSRVCEILSHCVNSGVEGVRLSDLQITMGYKRTRALRDGVVELERKGLVTSEEELVRPTSTALKLFADGPLSEQLRDAVIRENKTKKKKST